MNDLERLRKQFLRDGQIEGHRLTRDTLTMFSVGMVAIAFWLSWVFLLIGFFTFVLAMWEHASLRRLEREK